MVRTWLTTPFCILLVTAVPSLARAQNTPVTAEAETSARILPDTVTIPVTVRSTVAPRRGSSLTRSLYVSTVAMQALDVHSTMSALRQGAVEANPLMSGVTRHPALFMATKAAAATCMIMAARSLGKKHKFAAAATLVGLNSALLVVASHNYKLAHRLR